MFNLCTQSVTITHVGTCITQKCLRLYEIINFTLRLNSTLFKTLLNSLHILLLLLSCLYAPI